MLSRLKGLKKFHRPLPVCSQRVTPRFMGGHAPASGDHHGDHGDHDDHHDHGPLMPPFARLAPPTGPLPIEIELVWDDSVAPETVVDFDAPHISSKEVLGLFALGAAFFIGLYTVIAITEPEKRAPIAHKSSVISAQGFLYDTGLSTETGDEAHGEEEHEDEE